MSTQDPTPTEPLPDDAASDPARAPVPDPADAADGAQSAVPVVPVVPVVPAPDVADLERIAEPAVVRRAPRYGAFIRTGVVLGIVIGWMVAAAPPSAPDESRASVIGFTVFALAVLGALLGAGFAVVADRRSHRGG